MNPIETDRVDQLLASPPPMAPAPPGLHSGVMERIAQARSTPARAWRIGPIGLVGLAAAFAFGAVVALRTPPAPSTPPKPVANLASTPAAVPFPLDPTPALAPVTRFVAGSLNAPVRGQIDSLLDDTRRARDLVVSCLPFGTGG